jgi:Flp pilus assembly protein TadB
VPGVMVAGAAAGFAAAAVLLAILGAGAAAARGGGERAPTGPTTRAGPPSGPDDARVRRYATCVVLGLVVGLFVGGIGGCVAAPVVACAANVYLAKAEARAAARRRRARLVADLPTAADLLAACLLAGAAPVDAVAAVATAVGGPRGAELRAASAAIRLGGDPARCWMALAEHRELAVLARALARSGTGGAPPAERIARIADDYRSRRRRDFAAAARRASVRATLPLGVCFLPAFLLIGVVPVAIGLAGPLLSGT